MSSVDESIATTPEDQGLEIGGRTDSTMRERDLRSHCPCDPNRAASGRPTIGRPSAAAFH